MKTWTLREEKLLGRYRAMGMTWDEVAELLGRTEDQVRQRLPHVGLPARRVWAPDEDAFVRANYPAMKAEQIAQALARSLSSVRGFIQKNRLSRPRVLDHRALRPFIRAQHALGWSDAEIASAWAAEHPDQPVSREWITEVRREKLGLPHNAYSEHRRRQVAARTAEQCRSAGVRNLGEVRSLAYREFARRNGWPEDLRPRAVQILKLLYERGPHTRQQIAAAIGMPWKGSRKSLVSNDAEGSYLAHLIGRGLVVQLPRLVKGRGPGHSVHLYAIGPHVRRKVS